MPLTSKDQILGVQDTQVEEVFVKPWNDSVFIRVVTAKERDAFEVSMLGGPSGVKAANLVNFRARLAAICLCNEKGERVFTLAEAKDLGEKSSRAMDIIVAAARKLNGITKEDQENLVKNLNDVQGEDSNSGSA